jgi:hypothetical protein
MRILAKLISSVHSMYLLVRAKLIMSEIILNHLVEFRSNILYRNVEEHERSS